MTNAEKYSAYFYFVQYGIDKHSHKHYSLMLCKAMFGWWELKRIWTPSFAPFLPSFLAQTKNGNSVESVENIGIWILTKADVIIYVKCLMGFKTVQILFFPIRQWVLLANCILSACLLKQECSFPFISHCSPFNFTVPSSRVCKVATEEPCSKSFHGKTTGNVHRIHTLFPLQHILADVSVTIATIKTSSIFFFLIIRTISSGWNIFK